MRVFKVKVFARFQRREGVRDAALVKAIRDAEAGLVDADLGRGLIKQRVARPGGGKRGGYRTVIAYRLGDRAIYPYGFAKRDKADLSPDELATLAGLGARWLAADDEEIEGAVNSDELKVIDYGEA